MSSGELNTTVSPVVKVRGKTVIFFEGIAPEGSAMSLWTERGLNDLRIQCTIRDLDTHNRLLVLRGRIIHKHVRSKMDILKKHFKSNVFNEIWCTCRSRII